MFKTCEHIIISFRTDIEYKKKKIIEEAHSEKENWNAWDA